MIVQQKFLNHLTWSHPLLSSASFLPEQCQTLRLIAIRLHSAYRKDKSIKWRQIAGCWSLFTLLFQHRNGIRLFTEFNILIQTGQLPQIRADKTFLRSLQKIYKEIPANAQDRCEKVIKIIAASEEESQVLLAKYEQSLQKYQKQLTSQKSAHEQRHLEALQLNAFTYQLFPDHCLTSEPDPLYLHLMEQFDPDDYLHLEDSRSQRNLGAIPQEEPSAEDNDRTLTISIPRHGVKRVNGVNNVNRGNNVNKQFMPHKNRSKSYVRKEPKGKERLKKLFGARKEVNKSYERFVEQRTENKMRQMRRRKWERDERRFIVDSQDEESSKLLSQQKQEEKRKRRERKDEDEQEATVRNYARKYKRIRLEFESSEEQYQSVESIKVETDYRQNAYLVKTEKTTERQTTLLESIDYIRIHLIEVNPHRAELPSKINMPAYSAYVQSLNPKESILEARKVCKQMLSRRGILYDLDLLTKLMVLHPSPTVTASLHHVLQTNTAAMIGSIVNHLFHPECNNLIEEIGCSLKFLWMAVQRSPACLREIYDSLEFLVKPCTSAFSPPIHLERISIDQFLGMHLSPPHKTMGIMVGVLIGHHLMRESVGFTQGLYHHLLSHMLQCVPSGSISSLMGILSATVSVYPLQVDWPFFNFLISLAAMGKIDMQLPVLTLVEQAVRGYMREEREKTPMGILNRIIIQSEVKKWRRGNEGGGELSVMCYLHVLQVLMSYPNLQFEVFHLQCMHFLKEETLDFLSNSPHQKTIIHTAIELTMMCYSKYVITDLAVSNREYLLNRPCSNESTSGIAEECRLILREIYAILSRKREAILMQAQLAKQLHSAILSSKISSYQHSLTYFLQTIVEPSLMQSLPHYFFLLDFLLHNHLLQTYPLGQVAQSIVQNVLHGVGKLHRYLYLDEREALQQAELSEDDRQEELMMITMKEKQMQRAIAVRFNTTICKHKLDCSSPIAQAILFTTGQASPVQQSFRQLENALKDSFLSELRTRCGDAVKYLHTLLKWLATYCSLSHHGNILPVLFTSRNQNCFSLFILIGYFIDESSMQQSMQAAHYLRSLPMASLTGSKDSLFTVISTLPKDRYSLQQMLGGMERLSTKKLMETLSGIAPIMKKIWAITHSAHFALQVVILLDFILRWPEVLVVSIRHYYLELQVSEGLIQMVPHQAHSLQIIFSLFHTLSSLSHHLFKITSLPSRYAAQTTKILLENPHTHSLYIEPVKKYFQQTELALIAKPPLHNTVSAFLTDLIDRLILGVADPIQSGQLFATFICIIQESTVSKPIMLELFWAHQHYFITAFESLHRYSLFTSFLHLPRHANLETMISQWINSDADNRGLEQG